MKPLFITPPGHRLLIQGEIIEPTDNLIKKDGSVLNNAHNCAEAGDSVLGCRCATNQDPDSSIFRYARKLTPEEARKQGHQAAEACADRAGDVWKEDALEAVRDYAKRGGSFTTETVRENAPIDEPHDSRAWGAVMLKAKRLGYIEPCGAVPVASSRGGFKTLWRATQ